MAEEQLSPAEVDVLLRRLFEDSSDEEEFEGFPLIDSDSDSDEEV